MFRTLEYPKAKFNVEMNGQKQSFTGRISIIHNEEIFASVNAFLGIEVGRIILNKDSVVVKSNFEKKLYILRYGDIARKFGMAIDFNALETILCYQYKFYGRKNYSIEPKNQGFTIQPNRRIADKVIYDALNILLSGSTVQITDVQICPSGIHDCIEVNYSDFNAVEGLYKPYSFNFNDSKGRMKVAMQVSKAKLNDKVNHSLGNTKGFQRVYY